MAGAENFRQTEDFDGRNQIGEALRGSFVYPSADKLPDAFKQKVVPNAPDQKNSKPRTSRDFFKKL